MKKKKRKPPQIRAVFPPVTKNKWRLLTVEEAVLLKKAFGNELDITGIKIFVHSIWTTGNGLKGTPVAYCQTNLCSLGQNF